MNRSRALLVPLVLLCVATYLLTLGGRFYSIDEDLYLRMTHSLVRNGSFAIKPIEYAPGFSTAVGVDGRFYANRGPAWPILSIPFFKLGDALTAFGPGYAEPSPDGISQPTVFTLAVTLGNVVVVAVTVALLFMTVALLGYSNTVSATVSLLFGLGTMAWPYASKSFFAEPLLMLCTLASFYWALRYRADAAVRGQPNYAFVGLSALCLGVAILSKVTALALAPFLLWYFLMASMGSGLRWRHSVSALLVLVLVGSVFVGILAWYNVARFGSVFRTGYEAEGLGAASVLVDNPREFIVGVYGLLVSPGKGLLFHALPVVLSAIGIRRFWSSHRLEAGFIILASAATVVGVALWRDWSGGWCWGPRLILNVLPLLMIPAAASLGSASSHWPRRRLLWPAIFVFGSVSQLIGVLPNYLAWYLTVGNYNRVYYDPAYAPLRGHAEAILHGKIDLFWMKTDVFFPAAGGYMTALLAAIAAMAAFAAIGLVYHWRRSARQEVTFSETANPSI